MAKETLGTKTGTCTVCGINCWDDGKPSIWPVALSLAHMRALNSNLELV